MTTTQQRREAEIHKIMERTARAAGRQVNIGKTKIQNWSPTGFVDELTRLRSDGWWRRDRTLTAAGFDGLQNTFDRIRTLSRLNDGPDEEHSRREAELAEESIRRRKTGEPPMRAEVEDDVDERLLPNETESVVDYFARLATSIDFHDSRQKSFIDGLRSFASRFRGDAKANLLDKKVVKSFLNHTLVRTV